MRYLLVALCTLFFSATSAFAQLSIGVGIGLPGVNIGINVPTYPNLVPVPGYPVYYAPGMSSNYFFYDGMYWVYQNDNWYSSTWYNGPWGQVPPEAVPLFILRVPVRYYRRPPGFFHGWASGGAPHWGEHFGPGWTEHHGGWDKWDHASAPRAAPLPTYQRSYSGNRYPAPEQQQAMHNQNYHYQPHEAVVQQHFQTQSAPHVQPEQNGFERAQRQGQAPGRPPEGRPPVQQEMHQQQAPRPNEPKPPQGKSGPQEMHQQAPRPNEAKPPQAKPPEKHEEHEEHK
jgi:hypothetical protein